MQIDSFELGDFMTNCYVLRTTPQDKSCLLIDPGFDPEPLIEFLQSEDLQPQRIILTHGHCDHIAGIPALKELYSPLPVSISRDDALMLTRSRHNLSLMMGLNLRLDSPDTELLEGDIVEFLKLHLEVLATPGHTPGGICFYCPGENILFAGDTLFAGSIGRTDFPGGSTSTLIQSIRDKLLVLPDETTVYSGHGPASTIGEEKRMNPFIQ